MLDNLEVFAESRWETSFTIFLFPNHWALFRVKMLTSHLLDTICNNSHPSFSFNQTGGDMPPFWFSFTCSGLQNFFSVITLIFDKTCQHMFGKNLEDLNNQKWHHFAISKMQFWKLSKNSIKLPRKFSPGKLLVLLNHQIGSE